MARSKTIMPLLDRELRIIKLLKKNPMRHKQKVERNKNLLTAMNELKPFMTGFSLHYFLNMFRLNEQPIEDLTQYKNIIVVLNRLLKNHFNSGFVVGRGMFYFFK